MTVTRETYHRGNLPADLRKAVQEIVLERGIVGVTMAEAARRTGVSPGAPYRHFDSLDELIMSTAVECYERFAHRREMLLDKHGDEPPEVQIALMIHDFFTFIDEDRASYLLIFESGLGQRSHGLWPFAQQDFDRVLRLLAQAVGAPEEACRDLAMEVSGLVIGLAKINLEGFSPVSTLEEAPDLAVQGLRFLIAGARACMQNEKQNR